MIFSRVTLTETDQEPSVLEEVDKDIERAIEICQEAGESAGAFYIIIKLSMKTQEEGSMGCQKLVVNDQNY